MLEFETKVLWISLALLLLFIIVYTVILRKFKQSKIEKTLFINVHPLDQNPVSGIATLYIETYTPIEVEISIFPTDMSSVTVIEKKTLKKGANIIKIDSTKFENGFYFYQVITPNQKSKKIMEIRNV
ncbi:MAG: T9SS type A sorting domain-containing protein [Brumimicrobium sp.]